MRRKRKEITSLGVSAIDVFASALGVFIIMTSISLPFMFNTAQISGVKDLIEALDISEDEQNLAETIQTLVQEITNLKEQLEYLNKNTITATELTEITAALKENINELTEKLDAATTELTSHSSAKGATTIPPIDLVIIFDTTGSMLDYLEDLKKSIIFFMRILDRWSDSPALGIVQMLDECDWHKRVLLPLKPLTKMQQGDTARFAGALRTISGSCNTTDPEGLHLALQDAVNMEWRDDATQRVIIIVADFPPYPHEFSNTLSLTRAFSSDPRNKVSVVQPFHNRQTNDDVTKMEEIARTGQGEYIPSIASFIGAILLAIS